MDTFNASRVRLYLGTEVSPAHRERLRRSAITTFDRSALLSRIATEFPNGFTVFEGAGLWRGPDGRTVTESTIVVEVLGDDGIVDKARAVGDWHRHANGQDSVLMTVETVGMEFLA